jgi:Inositol polyphosphate kinase
MQLTKRLFQEPDATPEKRAREYGKYPQQTKFGFRIVGMRFYDPSHVDADEKGFRYFQKPYGRSLTTRDQLMEAFRIFFSAGVEPPLSNAQATATTGVTDSVAVPEPSAARTTLSAPRRIRTRSISNLLVQLRPLRRWFEENKSLRFYASSLLIVYEGDTTQAHNSDLTTIKMIDFGRVRREAGGDQGYSAGLTTLKHIFTDIWNDEQERQAHDNDTQPK